MGALFSVFGCLGGMFGFLFDSVRNRRKHGKCILVYDSILVYEVKILGQFFVEKEMQL